MHRVEMLHLHLNHHLDDVFLQGSILCTATFRNLEFFWSIYKMLYPPPLFHVLKLAMFSEHILKKTELYQNTESHPQTACFTDALHLHRIFCPKGFLCFIFILCRLMRVLRYLQE